MVGDSLMIMSVEIEQTFNEVDRTRELIGTLLEENNIEEENVSRIELSLYEVIVNIIEHSSEKFNNNKIGINCYIEENSVRVVITNYGDKFDITKVKLPNIEDHYQQGKKRGLGIYFIRTLMDKVEYSYKKHTNTLTLVKEI